MIKFFRKIRQNLLSEGKTGKYLKYAIGEIILVVIGILIALQINNWNEGRKMRVTELTYLENLQIEFQQNLNRAYEDLEYSEFQTQNVTLLLKVIEGDTVVLDSGPLAVAIINCGWAHKVDFIEDVWEELKNIGVSNILSNPQLREAITSFHKSKDVLDYRNITEWNNYNIGFRRLVGERNIFAGSKVVELMEKRFEPMKIKDLPPSSFIIDQLQSLNGIGTFLADIKWTRLLTNVMYEDLISDIEQILRLLEKEIFIKNE